MNNKKIARSEEGPILAFFLKHPLVGLVGSAASVIGLLAGFVFFYTSRERPALTYYLNPAKAVVVRTGQTSHLSVQFDGVPLSGDVTAVQVAFWNAGRKPIRADSVLKPMVIRTNGARILEINVRKTTRDVVGIVLDRTRLGAGEVLIRWSILEKDDGGVLQLVYEGNEDVTVEAEAVLVGQQRILQAAPLPMFLGVSRLRAGYILFALQTFAIGALLWAIRRKRRRGQNARFESIMLACYVVLGPLVIIEIIRESGRLGPPFGF